MRISKIINDYGERYSPYMRNLVNHLPMGQLALYKLINNVEYVKEYSEDYVERIQINPVKDLYQKSDSLEETLGVRDSYEAALDIIKKKIDHENIHSMIDDILNRYSLGMSSGLFHTLIRLAYAVEGYDIDKDFIDEVARALAYYITGYRQADRFHRQISRSQVIEEMTSLEENLHIKKILDSYDSLGQRMKALYNSDKYLKKAFVIEGDGEEKIRGLLDLLIPTYRNSKNIVVLHCITGLHALIVLKDYFKDFEEAIDIFTSCVITHLSVVDNLKFENAFSNHTEQSWDCLKFKAAQSSDVHAIKLSYSSYELDKLYGISQLKDCALLRIKYK